MGGLETEPARRQRALDRERQARSEAEAIAEKATRKLYVCNRELESRIEARTHELRETNQRLEAEVAERRSAQAGLARHALEQEVIGEIGRIISSSLDIGEVYDRFAERAHRLIPFDRVAVVLVDAEDDTFTMAYVKALIDVPGRQAGERAPLAGSVVQEVVRSHAPLCLEADEPGKLTERFPGLRPQIAAGIQSFLTVPLISRNNVIGSLGFASVTPRAFSPQHAALAERIAAQIAGAVANTRLYATVKRDALEKEALAAIGRVISSSVRIEDVYEPFVDEVRKLIPFERIGISAIDLEKGELTVAYVVGFDVQARRRGMSIPLAETVSEEIVRTRSGLLVQPRDRAELRARFPLLLPHYDAGTRSFLTIPLISRNEVIGNLLLWSTEPNRYSERDLALAERIGSQIAGAIANSQLYADRARAESALIQYSHDLAQSNGELEQFAYVASHDLQEPLRMVSSYTQLLARRYRGQLDSDADDFISFAVDGAQRMQKLIDDLLEYSRVGSRGNAPEPTNLEEVLDAALANLTAAIEESGAEVTSIYYQ